MIAGSLEIELMANVARLQKDMQQARATVDNTFDAIGRDVGRMKALLGTLFMGVSVGNLLNAVNEVKEAAVQVDRLAAMSRSSTDDFQKMASGAKSVGIDMSKFGDIMKDVQDKVGDFLLTGEGELKDFFETIAPKVGVTAEQFRKLSGPDALQLFYTSLEKAGVGQMVMINQMEAIADEASALAPLLANNGAELKRLGDEAQRTGAIMSTELITASKNLDAEIKQLQGVMTGITNTVMTGVMPALASMADAAERDISAGFESTYKWVQANRAELDAMWAITQSIGVATWEILAPIGEILVATGKWSVESGAVGTILTTVGLLIAGLKDGVTLVGASFISVGANIQNAVLGPIADFVHGLGTIMQMTGASDMGATFISAAGAMKNMGVTALQYVADVEDQFLRGDTAVARFRAGLQDTATSATATAKSTKSAYDNLGTGAGISAKATEEAKKAAEKAAAAAKKLAEDGKKLAASLLAEDSGLSGDFSEKWAQLSAAYKAHSITLDVLTQAQARMLSQQPAMKAAAEAEKKAQQEAAEAYAQTVDDRDKALLSIKEEIEQERQAIAELGMSKEAITALTVAKLEEAASSKERRAALADEFDWSGQLGATYRAEAKALRDLAVLKKEHATKEIATDAAKDAAEQWKRASDQIETSLTDALMRGFEDGKGFAKNLGDTLVNMFKTLVLRPVISAVVNPIAGAVTSATTGALGISGSANAASTASSLVGAAGTASAFGSAFSAGATIGTEAFSAGVTMMAEASGMSSFMAGAGQALGAVGPVGWAAMAALAAAALLTGRGETRSGATYGTGAGGGVTKLEGPSGGEIAAIQARAMFTTVQTGIQSALEKFGSQAVLTGFTAGLESSTHGKGFAFAGGMIDGKGFGEYLGRNGGQFAMGDKTPEQAIKDYELNLKQAAIQAFQQATDLPKLLMRELKAMDVEKMDVGQLDTAIASIVDFPNRLLKQFGGDRDALVQKFAEGMATGDAATAGQNVALSLVSSIEQTVMTAGAGQIFDAVTTGMIAPMLDAIATGTFTSEAISKASMDAVAQKVTEQAQALGALFANTDFRAALDQIKTTVGSALGSAGAAMNYQPTYWQPDTGKSKVEQSAAEKAAEDLAKRIKDALDGLKTDGLSLQIELLRAQGNDAAAAVMELNKATEGWDAANRELYRQRLAENAVLKEQIRAQQNLNTLRSDAATLAIDLLRAQGDESAALRAERDLAIKGWTDLEIAQYDVNAATRAQIQATTDLKTAMEALVGTADNVAEKFLSPDMLGQYRVQRITDQLNNPALGIGVDFSAQALDAIGIDGLKTVVLDFVRSDAGPQAKNAVLSLGASLLDLKLQAQAAEDAVAATRTGADIKLLQAQGDAQAALALQRELDTRGMTAAQVAAHDYAHAIDQQITAMQEATAVAATRTGADIKLLQAQGDAQAALALQRELDTRGMTAAQVAAYDYAHAIDAQVAAMQQRQGLEQSIAQALGQTALLRERELAALDASNRPLQMRLYALTDAATAMDAAMSGVQRAVDADKNKISKAAAAQIEALRTGIDTGAKSITEAQNQVNTLTGLFGNIADAVKNLRGVVNPELDLLQARSYIDMSLSLAKAGTLPDAKKLQDAISAVSKDNVDGYATVADFEFAQLVQAGKLDELGGLVGAQKSVQELQLDSMTSANKLAQDQITAIEKARDAQLAVLDEQLKSAQDQVSIAKGIDISVTSVATAMGVLSASIAGMTAARTAAASAMPSSGGAGGGGASAASSGSAASTVDWGYTASPLSNYQQTGGTTFTDGNGTMRDIAGLQVPMGLLVNASDVTGNLGAVRDYAVSNGLSAADVASAYQQIGRSNTDSSDILSWAAANGLPAFAAGGQHAGGLRVVGERGIEIEATGPARYWNAADTQQFLGGGGGTSARLEQLFEQLLARIEALEQQGLDAQKARDELHDLLYRVTEGGNAIRSDLVAISEEKLEKWLTTSTQ